MAEEVKPEAIKKTQTALSKYIKKPPLTDKLLKKPPFRFLHDIVTSVVKETGFLEGVFTAEELVADNVKDRDGKVKFLTKLINAVKQATGNPIKAKPNKIVAGLEADKTLELLQALAKGIGQKNNKKKSAELNQKEKKKSKESNEGNNKKDTKDKEKLKEKLPASSPVKQTPQEEQNNVLENGEQQSEKSQATEQGKEGLDGTENGEAPEVVNGGKLVENGEVEKPGTEKNRESDVRRSGRRRERSAVRIKEGGELGQNGLQENGSGEKRESEVIKEEETRRSGRRRERSSARRKESGNGGGEPAENGLPAERPGSEEESSRKSGRRREGREEERRGSSRKREASASRNKEDSEVEDGDQKGSRRKGSQPTDPTQERVANASAAEAEGDQPRRRSSLRKNDSQEKTDSEEVALKRPQTKRASSRSSRGPLKAFGEKEKRADLKEEDEDEGRKRKADRAPLTLGGQQPGQPLPRPPSSLERPRTARRAPPSARPPSARSSRPPSAKPGAPRTRDRGEVENDISKDDSEKEIKEVVVITEADENEDKEDMVVVENPSLQINEVDTTIDDSSGVIEGVLVDSILATQAELEKKKSNRAQVDIEWEGRRENSWERERQRLRESVQNLTRAAGPLGKLFAFLQEDVDLASRELGVWRKAAASFTQQLAAEQKLTDEMLKRHGSKLSELDSLIEEQHEAIRSLKSSILTNDRKIQSHISRSPAR